MLELYAMQAYLLQIVSGIPPEIMGWILKNAGVLAATIPGWIALALSIYNAVRRKLEERLDLEFAVTGTHAALSHTGDFLWIWFDIFLVNPSSKPNSVWSMIVHFHEGLTKDGKAQEVSAPVLEEIPYHPPVPGHPPETVETLAQLAFPMFVRPEDLPVGLDTTKLLKPPVSLAPFSSTEKGSLVVLLRSPPYSLDSGSVFRTTVSYKDLRGEHRCLLWPQSAN